MTEYYFIIKCPLCGREHKVWLKQAITKELNGFIVCPITQKAMTLRIEITIDRLRFSKEDIQRAYEEADERENLWWMEELRMWRMKDASTDTGVVGRTA